MQFILTCRDGIDFLDGKSTVFGIIAEDEGLDVLSKINESFVDESFRPLYDIRCVQDVVMLPAAS